MDPVTIYCVLDGHGYRRLETLSKSEADNFLWYLRKHVSIDSSIVSVTKPATDHTQRSK